MTATHPRPRRKPRGRPTGTSDTKETILSCARELFARNGFNNTSVRSIASSAGVDAALVHHYFGTKQQLFAAAVHIPIDPQMVLGPLRNTPVDELGHTLPSLLLPIWDSELGTGFIAALRSMLADGGILVSDNVTPAGARAVIGIMQGIAYPAGRVQQLAQAILRVLTIRITVAETLATPVPA